MYIYFSYFLSKNLYWKTVQYFGHMHCSPRGKQAWVKLQLNQNVIYRKREKKRNKIIISLSRKTHSFIHQGSLLKFVEIVEIGLVVLEKKVSSKSHHIFSLCTSFTSISPWKRALPYYQTFIPVIQKCIVQDLFQWFLE